MADRFLKPALTPEEWREVAPVFPETVAYPHKTMALANASLPNDDPRKITRANVTDLRHLAKERRISGLPNTAIVLDEIAAKLAALLPPE